jgi:anti-anti-sigma factor
MASQSQTCSVQAHDFGDRSVIRFSGSRVVLDELTTHLMGEQLLGLVERLKAGWMLVDMQNVAYLTSTALGLFLRLHRELHARGGHLTLCHLGPQLHEVFQVTNLHNLFDIRQRAEVSTVGATQPA